MGNGPEEQRKGDAHLLLQKTLFCGDKLSVGESFVGWTCPEVKRLFGTKAAQIPEAPLCPKHTQCPKTLQSDRLPWHCSRFPSQPIHSSPGHFCKVRQCAVNPRCIFYSERFLDWQFMGFLAAQAIFKTPILRWNPLHLSSNLLIHSSVCICLISRNWLKSLLTWPATPVSAPFQTLGKCVDIPHYEFLWSSCHLCQLWFELRTLILPGWIWGRSRATYC